MESCLGASGSAPFSSQSAHREAAWQAMGLSVGVCTTETCHNSRLAPQLWLLSCLIKIFLFCSLSFFLGWDISKEEKWF